jgi:hypothetical protein
LIGELDIYYWANDLNNFAFIHLLQTSVGRFPVR